MFGVFCTVKKLGKSQKSHITQGTKEFLPYICLYKFILVLEKRYSKEENK